MEDTQYIPQNIIIDDREHLRVSGVKEVLSFDDETLQLDTVLGKLTIKGEELHILSFHTETGDLSAKGKIHAAVYISDSQNTGGFISRIFR